MNYRERLVESDLQELLGGHRPPDLTLRALQRLKGAPAPETTHEPAALPLARESRARWWLRAATIVLALGLLGWLATRPQPLPAAVKATAGARYSTSQHSLQLSEGWLLLTDGAPEVRVGPDRVSGVQGRAVAGVGTPAETELAALAAELELTNTETEMIATPSRWLAAGALALCVLTGQALLNDELVKAQAVPETPAPTDTPKPQDLQAVCRLLSGASEARIRTLVKGGFSGWLRLRDQAALDSLKAALPGALTALRPETRREAHVTELLLTLKDGTTAHLGMNSAGAIASLRVPGWLDYSPYDVSPALWDALKPHLEAARRLQRYPMPDWQAMRDQMELADEVEFRDEYKRGFVRTGALTTRADIARLAALVWPDDMGMSKTHISEYEPFELHWRMPDGAVFDVHVSIGNAGKLSQTIGVDSRGGPEVLPDSSLPAIHELLQGAAEAPGFGVRGYWYGAYSKVEKARTQFITDEAEWWQVWVEHKTGSRPGDRLPDIDLPAVDFRKHVVLAVFGGKGRKTNAFLPVECLAGSHHHVVRLAAPKYQTLTDYEGAEVDTCPFSFVLLPRGGASIHAELLSALIPGQSPAWECAATLHGMGKGPDLHAWAPLQEWRGGNSRIETECSYLITDAESWRNLWKRHAGTEAPELDFGKVTVVAVFGGKQTREHLVPQDFRFVESLLSEKGPVVCIAGQATNSGMGLTPYGIFVMPAGPGAKGKGTRLELREHPLAPPNSEVDYSQTPRWLERDWTR
ncbi:MAG: hypothetical protein IT463_12360 [Planctomycetes bacterium]|nr:hypothetical protein [Planctomycetota bacterium]